jgi:hypothetical protein
MPIYLPLPETSNQGLRKIEVKLMSYCLHWQAAIFRQSRLIKETGKVLLFSGNVRRRQPKVITPPLFFIFVLDALKMNVF